MPNNSRNIIQLRVKLFKSRGVEFCRSMHPVLLNINNNEAPKRKLFNDVCILHHESTFV
jgi:hypothetical protein